CAKLGVSPSDFDLW
nr:immunoglobulin heavy chain junction region [Macaca mulatta]